MDELNSDASRSPSHIVCAALRQKGTGRVVCGPRHFDAIMWAQILDIPFEQFLHLQAANELPDVDARHRAWQGAEEGFIDQHGRFYTREEAWQAVQLSGQPLKRNEPFCKGALYSENLY